MTPEQAAEMLDTLRSIDARLARVETLAHEGHERAMGALEEARPVVEALMGSKPVQRLLRRS